MKFYTHTHTHSHKPGTPGLVYYTHVVIKRVFAWRRARSVPHKAIKEMFCGKINRRICN